MHEPVNRRRCGHRIFEDAFPLTEHQIARNEDGAALVALRQQREEHLHFFTGLLGVAEIVDGEPVKLGRDAEFKFNPHAFRALGPEPEPEVEI